MNIQFDCIIIYFLCKVKVFNEKFKTKNGKINI